jgi:hypothetical protein
MTTIDRTALAEFNARIRAARRDYTLHPIEFDDPRYCPHCVAIPKVQGVCARCQREGKS